MKRWFAAVIVAGLLVAGWMAFHHRHGGLHQKSNLAFLFTCDVRGRLVPCGCFSGQLGGLTRIATLFGKSTSPDSVTVDESGVTTFSFHADAGAAPIKVDVGDALAGSADYELIQYRYLQRAFASMGYEALNVGHREARLSAAQLKTIKAAAPVTMLSANLLDKTTHAPVFEPWKIVHRGPWRIALIGVLDPRGLDGLDETLGEGLVVEEMEVALEKILPKLKGEADFCVLLAFADEAALSKLAAQFYELDVILGGKVSEPSQRLLKENRSLILATTNEARAVGVLETNLVSKNRLEAVKGEVKLVGEDIPQDEEIRALAQKYRDEVRKTKLSIDDLSALQEDMVPGVKATASYAGSQHCAACHASAWKAWAQSGHSSAFAALKNAGADADPNCIGCHTVGFGALSGYLRQYGGKKLVDVGCESCHGPGSRHVEQHLAGGEITARMRPVSESDCRKCHHGEFSRPFAWSEFWPRIAHGKEAAAR